MWIFTKDGFFSVTYNKRDDDGTLMVRARVREDLERVRLLLGLDAEVIESKRSDYRYRLIMSRGAWEIYVSQAVRDIDYTNVKDTLAPMKTDPERHRAMLKCWSAMYALQPGGRRGWDLDEWNLLPDADWPDDDEWEWEEEV